MKHLRFGTLGVLLLLTTAAPAAAAPTTVNLRVEASNGTLFEAPITTDAKNALASPSSNGPHHCDGTNGGANATPGPTMTTALDDAHLTGAFNWDGTYDTGLDDFLINTIGPDSNSSDHFWGLYINWQFAPAGGCQVEVHSGDQVLFAYAGFTDTLLQLTGPTSAQAGHPFTVAVQSDDGSGNSSPASGASIGGQTTDGSGHATLTFATPGTQHLKASMAGAIRSNALDVCVYATNASECAPTAPPAGGVGGAIKDKLPPEAAIRGIRNGEKFRRHHGPRKLIGSAKDASGLFQVYFRLQRRSHAGCQWYSAKRSVFTRPHRHCKARFQRVGTKSPWSYLLPKRLPKGRYTLEEKALDSSFNRTLTRVRFRVL